MERDITVIFEPKGRIVRTAPGKTIFQTASEAGVSLRSECGGKGVCGKCKVVVQNRSAVTKLSEAEVGLLSSREIDSGYRLACRTTLKKNTEVTIPEVSRIRECKIQMTGLERLTPLDPSVRKYHFILPKPSLQDVRPDFERLLDQFRRSYGLNGLEIDYEVLKKLPDILRDAHWDVTLTVRDGTIIAAENGDTSNKLFGLAIDIGTSKIVVYVVDLITGETVGMGSAENPQVKHGEDVMSRIGFAMAGDEKLELLQELAIKGINNVLADTYFKGAVDPNDVYEANIVGNTAMHHFFLGIQPKHVALSPYTPAIRKSMDVKAKELKIKMHLNGVLHILPLIAGFVGADAIGDALATGIYEEEEPSMLLDIGTNTEVLLGNAEDILCCSCASGPAFEGTHIKDGMKAVSGAIEKVQIDPNSFEVEYETIGGAKPIGLCGSAVIDVVAGMLKCGLINTKGEFNLNMQIPRLKVVDNHIEFILVWENETGTGKEIVFTGNDIRQIQLAKAAIFTGCTILMKRKNLRKEKLDRILIAGAFGSYINPENARFLGLVPDVPTERISFVGNTAVNGAKMALLSKEVKNVAEVLSEKIRYLELAADADFNSEFLNSLLIPHKDLGRFPSVKEYLMKLS